MLSIGFCCIIHLQYIVSVTHSSVSNHDIYAEVVEFNFCVSHTAQLP